MNNSISTTVLPDVVTAADELQLMLTREEQSVPTLYIDSNGYPSIGIGANLTVSANLIEVMKLLGVDPTSENVAKFTADLTANPNSLDNDVASLSTTGRITFSLQPQDINALFLFTSQNAIRSLNALLAANGTPIDNNTAQFMTLASLYFNSKHGTKVDLIGPKLLNALAAGDNAQAWYQIRYNTDANDSNGGIETRRLYESQVFGLNPGSPSLIQADQAYEMLAEHRYGILQKENSTVRQVGPNKVVRTFTVGVNPDGSEPVSTNLNPPNLIENAIENYGLFGSTGSSPVNQSVQTLAQIFNPDAEEIASTINTWFANIIPNVGILNDSMSGAFEVRSTDIEIAPDGSEIANGFATSSPDQIEASDSPGANHILIGPDSVNRLVPPPSISLIGGTGDDLLIAGAGDEILFGGLGGNDTLIGGQAGFITGNAGNDTLQGGSGTDKFVFSAPTSAGLTETILPWKDQLGSVEIVNGSSAVVLAGSAVAPVMSADGESITWGASPSSDDSGVTYAYSKISGNLTISGGLLGTGSGANKIVVQNFDLSAAQKTNFLGIHLEPLDQLNFGSTTGVDPPAPDFNSGATQSYTFSTDVASATAQTVTVALSGVNAADFEASAAGSPVTINSDGTFSFALPADQTNISFALTNTADPGASAPLQLSATLSDPANPNLPGVITNSLTQNFVETSPDPFATPTISTTSTITGASNNSSVWLYQDDGQNDLITVTDQPNVLAKNVSALQGGSDVINVSGTEPTLLEAGSGAYAINDTSTSQNFIATGGGNSVVTLNNNTRDVALLGWGQDQLYGGTSTNLASAINTANTGARTNQQGAFLSVKDGNNTIAGSTGNDAIIVGAGNNLILAGPGDDTILGGLDVTQAFGWSESVVGGVPTFSNVVWNSSGYTVPQGVTYEGTLDDVKGVPVGVGNDTIYGGSGNEIINLTNGNNYVDVGSGNSTVDGGMGNSTIIGGSGNDSVLGGGGSEYITGGSGNDTLIGRGGNNTIIGGSGFDTIFAGQSGASYATSETGLNYVDGGTGSDFIFGAGGSDTLIGGTGSDSIYGGAGNENIVGGSGNDLLVGGVGNDTIAAGGAGRDTILASGSSTSTTLIYGGDGTDSINGGSGSNTIYAGDGGTASGATSVFASQSDSTATTTIYGGTGVDLLEGGAGSSVIYAGDGGTSAAPTSVVASSGNATLYGGLGTDIIQGGSGTDVLYAGDGGTSAAPTTVNGGSGVATLYGGAGPSQLQDSASGSDLIVGGSANDTLIGTGNDTLIAGTGDDALSALSGSVTFQFNQGFGNDTVYGATGANSLIFGFGMQASDFTVSATLGTNDSAALVLSGDGGSVTVDGGFNPGAIGNITFLDRSTLSLQQLMRQSTAVPFTLAGSNGDLIFDTADRSSISGGAGADTISAWGNHDVLTAGSGGTLIYSEGGHDSLVGGSGNDTLEALSGNDTLVAGTGNDVLVAGPGNNMLVFNPGFGQDILTLASGNQTLQFGGGISESDLSVSFALVSGTPTLQIHDGQGTISLQNLTGAAVQLQFDDGSSLSLAQLVAQSNLPSTTLAGANGNLIIDTGNFNSVTAGSGSDTLWAWGVDDTLNGGAGNTQIYAAGSSDSIVGGSGNETIAAVGPFDAVAVGTGHATVTVNEFNGDSTTTYYQQGVRLSDTWSQTDGSSGSDTYNGDGSYTRIANDGLGDVTTTQFNAQGARTSDSWLKSDGSNGSDFFNSDGSYVGTVNDAQGDTTVTQYSTAGVALSDTWTKVDGSHGNDLFNSDGTSSGTTVSADGTFSTYVNNGQGLITTDNFDSSGVLSGSNTRATDSQSDVFTTYYGADGAKLSDAWTQVDGSHGSDTFNSDGSSSGVAYQRNGNYSTYTNDGQGDLSTLLFNAQGTKTGDSWTHADGSFGSDTFIADGSSTGAVHAPDGSYSTYTNDGHGDIGTTTYNTQGIRTGETWVLATNSTSLVTGDGQSDVTTTIYNAAGVKLTDSWTKADGSHGSDSFNADGSSAGVTYYGDGASGTYTKDGHGQEIRKNYSWDGALTGYNVTETNGLGNSITSYDDQNGNKLKETWLHADGSSGTDLVSASDYNGALNLATQGYAGVSKRGNVSWQTPDGVSGDFSTRIGSAFGAYSFADDAVLPASSGTEPNNFTGAALNSDGSVNWTDVELFENNNSNILMFKNQTPQLVLDHPHNLAVNEVGSFDFFDGTTQVDVNGTEDTSGKKYLFFSGTSPLEGLQTAPTPQTPQSITIPGFQGTYSSFTDDGQGNLQMRSYDSQGVELDDQWSHNDGTYGADTFNADGSSSGLSFNPNGTFLTYTNDGHGDILAKDYPGADANVQPTYHAPPPPDTLHSIAPSPSRPPASSSSPDQPYQFSQPDGQGGMYLYSFNYYIGHGAGATGGPGTELITHTDAQGHLLSNTLIHTDPGYASSVQVNGVKVSWNYDSSGAPISSSADDGQGTVTTYQYNREGSTTGSSVAVTDNTGSVTTQIYDAAGHFLGHSVQTTAADGAVRTDSYDATGALSGYSITRSDGQGSFVTAQYDASGAITSLSGTSVPGSGQVNVTNYDANGAPTGSVVTTTGTQGQIASSFYDASGNLTGSTAATTDSAGNTFTSNYDASGNLTGYVTVKADGSSVSTLTTFNAQGGILRDETLQADGTLISHEYQADGSVVTTTHRLDHTYSISTDDGTGNVISVEYSSQGTKVSDTWSRVDGSSGTDTFAADGTIRGTALNADGTSSSYVNNGQNQIVSQHYAADGTLTGSSVTVNSQAASVTTNYNALGQKVSDSWIHADGSSGTDTFDTVGGTQADQIISGPTSGTASAEKVRVLATSATSTMPATAQITLQRAASVVRPHYSLPRNLLGGQAVLSQSTRFPSLTGGEPGLVERFGKPAMSALPSVSAALTVGAGPHPGVNGIHPHFGISEQDFARTSTHEPIRRSASAPSVAQRSATVVRPHHLLPARLLGGQAVLSSSTRFSTLSGGEPGLVERFGESAMSALPSVSAALMSAASHPAVRGIHRHFGISEQDFTPTSTYERSQRYVDPINVSWHHLDGAMAKIEMPRTGGLDALSESEHRVSSALGIDTPHHHLRLGFEDPIAHRGVSRVHVE